MLRSNRLSAPLGAALTVCLAFCGCGTPPPVEVDHLVAPGWIGHFGVFDGPNGRFVEAVGSSVSDAHPGTRRSNALNNGRSQLALTVAAITRAMVTEFVVSLRNAFSDELVESGEFTDDVTVQVTDDVMHAPVDASDSQQERWTDPITSTTYVLMGLEFDGFLRSYRDQMHQTFQRESTLRTISAGRDEFEGRLDEQIEWIRELTAAEITERFSAR
jgi:hypothetical protein